MFFWMVEVVVVNSIVHTQMPGGNSHTRSSEGSWFWPCVKNSVLPQHTVQTRPLSIYEGLTTPILRQSVGIAVCVVYVVLEVRDV